MTIQWEVVTHTWLPFYNHGMVFSSGQICSYILLMPRAKLYNLYSNMYVYQIPLAIHTIIISIKL